MYALTLKIDLLSVKNQKKKREELYDLKNSKFDTLLHLSEPFMDDQKE